MSDIKINIPSVTVKDLEKLATKVKQVTKSDETEVSFEMILCSFFPSCWKNIQKEMSHQYTQGYMQGYKDKGLELESSARRVYDGDDPDCYCE